MSALDRSALCDLLGVCYPVVQAPMAGGWTTPELVAGVSGAGGFGVLAGAWTSPDRLRSDIRQVRELTDRPFGVNFLLSPPGGGSRDVAGVQRFLDRFRGELGLPEGSVEFAPEPEPLAEQLEVVLEERVPVLSVGLGDPGGFVEPAREAGVRVMAMVASVEEAVRVVEEAGADAVVAQGAEAGGHRSSFRFGPDGELPLVGTMALVPQVVDAVDVPVVAAGGIMDGRGLAAALALGASGVQMGTRFLLARESGAFPAYRRRLLEATEVDTEVTRAFSGHPARGIRNRFVREYLKSGPEPLEYPLQRAAAQDIFAAARERDEGDYAQMLTGQGLRMLREEGGAAEIVAGVVEEAGQVLSWLAG